MLLTLHNVCAVHPGVFSTLEISLSTPGGVQYTGGYHWVHRGCSVHWGISWVHPGVFSTVGDTMMSMGDIMSTPRDVQYTGVSIQIQLFSQWPSPTFIMIYPRFTHGIPPVYSWYPPVCSWYSPLYSWYPPVYWTSPIVLHSPGVLHWHYAGCCYAWRKQKTSIGCPASWLSDYSYQNKEECNLDQSNVNGLTNLTFSNCTLIDSRQY